MELGGAYGRDLPPSTRCCAGSSPGFRSAARRNRASSRERSRRRSPTPAVLPPTRRSGIWFVPATPAAPGATDRRAEECLDSAPPVRRLGRTLCSPGREPPRQGTGRSEARSGRARARAGRIPRGSGHRDVHRALPAENPLLRRDQLLSRADLGVAAAHALVRPRLRARSIPPGPCPTGHPKGGGERGEGGVSPSWPDGPSTSPPGSRRAISDRSSGASARDLLEWDREQSAAALPQGFLEGARRDPVAQEADRDTGARAVRPRAGSRRFRTCCISSRPAERSSPTSSARFSPLG